MYEDIGGIERCNWLKTKDILKYLHNMKLMGMMQDVFHLSKHTPLNLLILFLGTAINKIGEELLEIASQ